MSTPVPTNARPLTMDDLFKKKGELVTQMEIAQGQLQQINLQIQQVLNSQPIPTVA